MVSLDIVDKKRFFEEGSILTFHDNNGHIYDGIVWKVVPEGASSVSVFIRFIDRL